MYENMSLKKIEKNTLLFLLLQTTVFAVTAVLQISSGMVIYIYIYIYNASQFYNVAYINSMRSSLNKNEINA